jgi:hypothetical protein
VHEAALQQLAEANAAKLLEAQTLSAEIAETVERNAEAQLTRDVELAEELAGLDEGLLSFSFSNYRLYGESL